MFEVRLSTPAPAAVSVRWRTADDGATAGEDYVAASGQLFFDTGEAAKRIEVASLDDRVGESAEHFTVTLSDAQGATIARATARATLADIDAPDVLTGAFSKAPAEHDGATRFEVVFELSEQPGGMSWRSVRDGLFDVSGGIVTGARRTGSVRNRQWTLSVAPSAYVRLGDAQATGTISNDDPMPRAWLARFGRTVAEQVLGAVEGRFEGARTGGGGEACGRAARRGVGRGDGRVRGARGRGAGRGVHALARGGERWGGGGALARAHRARLPHRQHVHADGRHSRDGLRGVVGPGRETSLGWRLVRRRAGGDIGSLELSSEARRRERADDDAPAQHTVGLQLSARW